MWVCSAYKYIHTRWSEFFVKRNRRTPMKVSNPGEASERRNCRLSPSELQFKKGDEVTTVGVDKNKTFNWMSGCKVRILCEQIILYIK
uniref:SH3 domain-containing protein n=1 Tax=Oryza brachyantha TaxID=4533 RepID=J3MYG9_ORYBR